MKEPATNPQPKRENQSSFAILGLLTLGSMSGYQLRKLSEESIQHFWRESFGQIYPTLKDLEMRGWVSQRREAGEGKPDSHVYSIADSGREALRRWLEQPVKAEVPRVEILLKLFFGSQLPIARAAEHLRAYRDDHLALLAIYDQTETSLRAKCGDHADLSWWLMTLSYGRHRSRAMIAWCEESLARLDAPTTHATQSPIHTT